MSLESLTPLIKKTGSTLTPKEFQNAVNVAFHDIEAIHYDEIHANMWESLQQQLDLLTSDLPTPDGSNLRLLDIGCGTGLSSELLLNTKIGKNITQITLADTSPGMLEEALKRSKGWNREIATANSTIEHVEGKFDIILVCSVLHHIPDLPAFLEKISELQKPGGIFIHLQDPNGDHLQDPELEMREKKYRDATSKTNLSDKVKALIPKAIKRKISQIRHGKSYLDKVNDILIGQKVIRKAMTPEEIWSVTDIHVDNLPYSVGEGISYDFIKKQLNQYDAASFRSYGFFGFLKSELPVDFADSEQKLIDERAKNGRHFGAVWQKRTSA